MEVKVEKKRKKITSRFKLGKEVNKIRGIQHVASSRGKALESASMEQQQEPAIIIPSGEPVTE